MRTEPIKRRRKEGMKKKLKDEKWRKRQEEVERRESL